MRKAAWYRRRSDGMAWRGSGAVLHTHLQSSACARSVLVAWSSSDLSFESSSASCDVILACPTAQHSVVGITASALSRCGARLRPLRMVARIAANTR